MTPAFFLLAYLAVAILTAVAITVLGTLHRRQKLAKRDVEMRKRSVFHDHAGAA